jgi:hypothetical protein
MQALRDACAAVARRSRHVEIVEDAIPAYAAGLSPGEASAPTDPETHLTTGTREELAAFWITLNAINFGSGWFPTLRKPGGRSGHFAIATRVRERFGRTGSWSAAELSSISAAEIASVLGQDPDHELMELFARSLRDLGARVASGLGGRFAAVVDASGGSAIELARRLGGWECYADSSRYAELTIPFLKRAQLLAADLGRADVASFADLDQLTMFADNLVPHVLRIDGVLQFEPQLIERIERQELIEHGSPEEVEIRACALHAVELLVAARADACAAQLDQVLWNRGQEARYKARPRHRSRCTAY